MPNPTLSRRCALPLLLPGLFFGLLAGPTSAAQWQTISGGKKVSPQVAVDLAGMVRNGDSVRVWHREVFSGRQVVESGGFSYISLKALHEINCAKRTALPVQKLYFAADGSQRGSDNLAGASAVPVVPDSTLEKVLSAACHKPEEKKPEEKKPEPPPPEPEKKPTKKKGKEEPPPPPPPDPHWSYDGKTDGASQWAKLKADWAVCAEGKRQSPIDIRDAIPGDLDALEFDYKPINLTLIDTGHTIQASAIGGGSVSVDGESFDLVQFNFHHPAEIKINGKGAEMAVHLLHRSATGKQAIVVIPLAAGKKENRLLRVLWTNLPLEPGKPYSPTDVRIDASLLLPKHHGYYTFMGSLSTPPCTEGVLWIVLKEPLTVSAEQIASFAKIYRANSRPVQAGNGRVIKYSR